MKRIFLLLAILFISVLSTACVNNLAIQELNNKAQEYMNKGDTESAIARLEASLDLDDNIFETRYNLGVAYLNAKQYDKAQEMLQKATELKPDFADTYYSLAIATDEKNYDEIERIKYPEKFVEEGETPVINEETTVVAEPENKKLTEEEKEIITQKVKESIDAYNKYFEKAPNAQEKASIESRINSLNAELDFESDSVVQ